MNRLLNTSAVLVAAVTMMFIPSSPELSVASADELHSTSATCTVPNQPAKTITAVAAEAPPFGTQDYLTGTADVQVDLDANGSILGTSILKSSGIPILDRAALRAANESSFQPEVRDCVAVAGSYIFVVTLTA